MFLRAHWEAIAATDFFTVEAWTLRGLTRFHVLFVLDLSTRRVAIAGITENPDGDWVVRVGRSLVDCFDGFLLKHRYLIHDRDPLFTTSFDAMLRSSGVEPIRLPPRSPNLNAYAERFVGSIKAECLDRMIIFGERHLRHVVSEYAEHYQHERPHQGPDRFCSSIAGMSPSRPYGAELFARSGHVESGVHLGERTTPDRSLSYP